MPAQRGFPRRAWETVVAAAATTLLLAAPAAAAEAGARVVFRITDDRITEASGMVDLGSRTVVTNDSGDGPRLFVVDEEGRTVAVREYVGAAVDVEALAPAGDDAVWVGDLGDNEAVRASVTVTRVPVDGGPVASYELTYPGGPTDAESLLVDPDGRLVVVTKSLGGGAVLRAPARLDPDDPNRLEQVATTPELAATDAALLSPNRVLVRGYGDAGLYAWPSWELLGRVPLPEQPQGEAVSVGPGGRVRVASEGVGQPVWQLPREATADPAGTTGPTPGPPESRSDPPSDPSSDPASDPPSDPAGASHTPQRPADDEAASPGVGRLALGSGLLLGGLGLAAVTWLVRRDRRST